MYLFPPFSVISRCFRNLQVEGLLITPVWKSHPWCPVILSLLTDFLIMVTKCCQLLQLPGTQRVHHRCTQKISRCLHGQFQGKWQTNLLLRCHKYFFPPGDRKLAANVSMLRTTEVAGVIRDRLIDPFSTALADILKFLSDFFHQDF